MLILVNYWLYIVLAIIAWMVYRRVKKSPEKWLKPVLFGLASFVFAIWLHTVLTAGVIPKQSVPRIQSPDFTAETTEGGPVIQDRLRTTVKPEDKAKEDFDKLVDWKSSRAKPTEPQPEKE